MEIADEGGTDALTMQRIGRRLGVEAMSLYRHVRNKDDLLDGLVDLVFGEIEHPARGSGWRTQMRRRAIAVRQVLARHPWAIELLETRSSPGPANLRHHDLVLAILRDAGFSIELASHTYNLMDSYILGFVLQEQGLPFGSREELAEVGEALLAQVPADVYPYLSEVAGSLLASGFDYADEFEWGLDLILDGIERLEPSGPDADRATTARPGTGDASHRARPRREGSRGRSARS
jgi:AcrR family transcriptional regulator